MSRSHRPRVITTIARRFVRDRLALIALIWIAILALAAAFYPHLVPYDPSKINLRNTLAPPSGEHWFGTDLQGRDVLSRLVAGGRVSLGGPAFAVGVTAVLGLPFGLVAGYFGGLVDYVLSRFADAMMAVPPIVLALGVVTALGPEIRNAMLAIGIVYAPRLFRTMRASALATRSEVYVEAAIASGCPTRRVITHHLLPNSISPVIVQLSVMMGLAILAEATLSFLGLGAQPPTSSWGTMLRQAYTDIFKAPGLIYIPGVVIASAILAFNLIGDGLRQAFGRRLGTAGSR